MSAAEGSGSTPRGPRRAVMCRAVVRPLVGSRRAATREGHSVLRGAWMRFAFDHAPMLRAYAEENAPDARKIRGLDYHVGRRMRCIAGCGSPMLPPLAKRIRCALPALCPFCWARSAGRGWDRIADLLHPRLEGSLLREPDCPFDLVATTRIFVLTVGPARLLTERIEGKNYRDALAIPSRVVELRNRPIVAGQEVMTLFPRLIHGGTKLMMAAAVRQLLVVEPGVELGPFKADPRWPEVKVVRYERPGLGRTMNAVANLYRYPAEILMAVPADRVLAARLDGALRLLLDLRRVPVEPPAERPPPREKGRKRRDARERHLIASFGEFRGGVVPRTDLGGGRRAGP
ncbi:hypothetical protein [Paludisphaera mucosa]|uniref:Uncharacterized protein n=1 Tax=Paludisphaera mucosa TaxID=3030827 RepID=A0ABT6F5K4_9BACT|nr:hypothetical protein [Paludisphaera mucosa]MDG3002862.1 hypothetical protein [Paludisphaera mucosa]